MENNFEIMTQNIFRRVGPNILVVYLRKLEGFGIFYEIPYLLKMVSYFGVNDW